MKNLILFSFLLVFSTSSYSDDQALEKSEDSGVVKVKLDEAPLTEAEESVKGKSPEVEIEIVEKINLNQDLEKAATTAKPDSDIATPATAALTPANPDKHLMLYFILLMAVVVGIMIIASLIPPPRSRNQQ